MIDQVENFLVKFESVRNEGHLSYLSVCYHCLDRGTPKFVRINFHEILEFIYVLQKNHWIFHVQRLDLCNIQLFQLTLSVQSIKLKDKTESLRGIFMNKFIKISHAWRKL